MSGPAKLPVVTPRAYAWCVECPACGYSIEDLDMEETNAGNFVVSGPDRYPVCDQCGEQFEVGEVSVEPVMPPPDPNPPGRRPHLARALAPETKGETPRDSSKPAREFHAPEPLVRLKSRKGSI